MQAPSHSVFADTSFYYAAIDNRDRCHGRAKELSGLLLKNNLTVISSWEIVVETITLLRNRCSYSASIGFIRDVLPTVQIFYIDDHIRSHALSLFERLSRDKQLSLCDVISYVLVSDHLGKIPCFAFDDDFKRLGLNLL